MGWGLRVAKFGFGRRGEEGLEVSKKGEVEELEWRSRWNGRYIYTIYTPNLGLKIAVSVREREHGRFRGSKEEVGSKGERRWSTIG